MKLDQIQREQATQLPIALETGLDEAVEFQIPEPDSLDCFFSLSGHSDVPDLLLVVHDFVRGQTEYRIDFDDAVDNLIDALANETPTSLQEDLDDIAMLKALAKRFESVAARLTEEARKREAQFEMCPGLAG